MKQSSLTLLLLLVVAGLYAQDKKALPKAELKDKIAVAPAASTPNPNAPKISFIHEEYDFGTVVEGPAITHDFKFTNNGKEPLVLSNVRASCGCTVPTWPKEPVLPSKQAAISATYNTQGRVGPFTKTITVESNASEPSKVVTIRGTVIKPEDDKSIPVAKPSMIRTATPTF
jgi:Protein of unknown function (DUF1573)